MTHKEIIKGVEEGKYLLVMDNPFSPLSEDATNKYGHITGRGWKWGFPKLVGHKKPPLPPAEFGIKQIPQLKYQEPGFYVVPNSTTFEKLKETLFSEQNPAVMSKFLALNPNPGNINAGSMIVLSDPNNLHCTREEALLMHVASEANDVIKKMSPEEADFMMRHRDEFENLLTHGATGIGVGEAIFSKHLDDVRRLMKDIEALHVKTFQATGGLKSAAFFAERKRLFAQLNTNLTALTRKSIGFPDHPNLKSALGISSRSLVHRWTAAGGADQIPGYATHIEGVSNAAKFVKAGGMVGTIIGGGASYMRVQDVCTAGDTEACRKIKFKEAGGFSGGIIGGALAGMAATSPIVASICMGLSIPSGGLVGLGCAVAVVGVGAFTFGYVGGEVGEGIGEVIYENIK